MKDMHVATLWHKDYLNKVDAAGPKAAANSSTFEEFCLGRDVFRQEIGSRMVWRKDCLNSFGAAGPTAAANKSILAENEVQDE